jgi:hypothetical protein
MIGSDQELMKAVEALGDLYRAISALKAELAPTNPHAFILLSEGPLAEIRRITAEIEEYSGTTLAESEAASLWLKLVGERARWRETPSSVLTAFLDALRKGVQTVAGYNLIGRIPRQPSVELQRACDFELLSFQPGSLTLAMKLPADPQLELFEGGNALYARHANSAMTEFIEAAKWAASQQPLDMLARFFPDAMKRRVVLRAVKPLIPRSGGGIDYVELSGRAVPDRTSIQLTHSAARRITAAVKEAVAENEESFEGDVREMDLDRQTFKLRNVMGLGEINCHYAEDIAPLASSLLGKRVRLIGVHPKTTRASPHSLEIVDIEPIQFEEAQIHPPGES